MTGLGWPIGGGILGAAAGAGLGALAGGKKRRWQGAAVGAAVGAAGGLAIGALVAPSAAAAGTLPPGSAPDSLSSACSPFQPQAGDSVYLVGDSLALGFGPTLKTAVNATWPNVAFKVWAANSENAASSASRVGNADVRGLVVLSLGSNDAAGAVDPDRIKALVKQLRAGGARVVWVVPPNDRIEPKAPTTKAKQNLFWDTIEGAGVEVLVPNDQVRDAIASDKVHLTPAGYEALGRQVAACIGATS